MDPRIAPPKPHRGSRQANRRSRRRYVPRANGQPNPLRYVPPLELRQSAYARNESIEPPTSQSRQSAELSWQSRREEAPGFSYATDDHSSQAVPSLNKPAPLSVSNQPESTSADAEQICVSLDYVPDRGRMLWSRWILILICLAQLLSAFAVIGCHAMDFSEDTKLEVGVSLGILAFGNILAPGVLTSVLFYRRWRSAETQKRSKVDEANHEAWICTRTAFSLIGMAPIARGRHCDYESLKLQNVPDTEKLAVLQVFVNEPELLNPHLTPQNGVEALILAEKGIGKAMGVV
ncbi:hypothetical protein TSMEX_006765 [Taenia solium]|eukprot:TsM_001188200 transcript=TsM_001188200 gene=TsM_001188200